MASYDFAFNINKQSTSSAYQCMTAILLYSSYHALYVLDATDYVIF